MCFLCGKSIDLHYRVAGIYGDQPDGQYTVWALYFHEECFNDATIYRYEQTGIYYKYCQICRKSDPLPLLKINDGYNTVIVHINCFRKLVLNKKLLKFFDLIQNDY